MKNLTILLNTTWLPRLGFALLLLCFGELVAWHQASTYSMPGWLAVAAIYIALAAITLDLLARWHMQEWLSAFLVAGIFGIGQSSLVTLALDQNLPLSLALFGTGVQTLMFLLAYGSFRLLYTGKHIGYALYLLPPVVGLAAGIWTRWLPELESVQLLVPEFDDTLPYTLFGLLACALLVFYMPLPEKITREDWMLMPMEMGISGGVLLVTLILRLDGNHLSTTGLVISGAVVGILGLMLWFTHQISTNEFRLLVQPEPNLLIRWVLMLFPFVLMGWVGYHLPSENGNAIQSTVLFWVLVIFGVLWLPLVSVWIAMRAFTELLRQEY